MLQIVFVGHITLIGILEGNVLSNPLALIQGENGWVMVPLIGVNKTKLSDVVLSQQILRYEVTDDDVKSAYVRATTGLILRQ